ncbi:MAG: DedA family protein [Candidatus Palauibacterales bacterium]|nr:DedA family protein [Candidatus Palauibacterales bacterium]MDP2529364.1 DedA family protein [Candidatus Palauibacterales bacterium]MDP2583229.1 DedA family protein [Candidatus Palauibacterales bacterium]
MTDALERILSAIASLPIASVYLLIGAGAALENIFPPVPSDTFVIVAGVLADRGVVEGDLVVGVAWVANVVLAGLVYVAARRYGRAVFDTRWGHWLLRPHQLERLSGFYDRYGMPTIFVSRFVPVFRVLVPVFAGISGLGLWRTLLPLGIASALWYGALLELGVLASRNIPRLVVWVQGMNRGLLVAALVAAAAAAWWWWRTRHHHQGPGEDGG